MVLYMDMYIKLSQEMLAAAQLPAQNGLIKQELTKPSGPSFWGAVFQAVKMGRIRFQMVPLTPFQI